VAAETVTVPVIPHQTNPNQMNQPANWLFLFSHFEGERCVVMAEVLDQILDRAARVRKKGKVTELLPEFSRFDCSSNSSH
jgi:hypothetical protein